MTVSYQLLQIPIHFAKTETAKATIKTTIAIIATAVDIFSKGSIDEGGSYVGKGRWIQTHGIDSNEP